MILVQPVPVVGKDVPNAVIQRVSVLTAREVIIQQLILKFVRRTANKEDVLSVMRMMILSALKLK